jgi:hypothetical protein
MNSNSHSPSEDDDVVGDSDRAALDAPARPRLHPRPHPLPLPTMEMHSTLEMVATRVRERGARVCVRGTMRERPFL